MGILPSPGDVRFSLPTWGVIFVWQCALARREAIDRQAETKGAALPLPRMKDQLAMLPQHDLLCQEQPNPRAIGPLQLGIVRPEELRKDLALLTLRHSNAMILHRAHHPAILGVEPYRNNISTRRVVNSIIDIINDDLPELIFID